MQDYSEIPDCLKISGNSMFPFVPHGSIVIIEEPNNNIYFGQIVFLDIFNKPSVHRIVYLSESFVVTKGDFSVCFDPPIARNEIKGIVKDFFYEDQKIKRKFLKFPKLSGVLNLLIWPFACLYGRIDETINKWIL